MLKKGNNSNMASRIRTKIWPQINLIMLNTLTQLNLTVLELYVKNTVWCLCSIFSNSNHVFQWIINPQNSSIQDTPRDIHNKFGSNWSIGYEEKSFEQLLTTTDDNDDRRQVS